MRMSIQRGVTEGARTFYASESGKYGPFLDQKMIRCLKRFFAVQLFPVTRRRSSTWQWRIYPDDVFLVSYTRSGNTWVRQMIALLKHPDLDLTKEQIHDYVPDPYYKPEAMDFVARPRVIKSHEQYTPEYRRVIYLYRDGRDCMVSWYDMETKLSGYKGRLDEFVLDCLSGSYGKWGSWQDHVRSWILVPHDIPILKVQYEGLCKKPYQCLKDIAIFLRLPVEDKKIEGAIHGSSKEVHQLFLRNNRSDIWGKGFQGGIKGGPGKWREVFSDKLLELYWEYAGDVMEELEYQREWARASEKVKCSINGDCNELPKSANKS